MCPTPILNVRILEDSGLGLNGAPRVVCAKLKGRFRHHFRHPESGGSTCMARHISHFVSGHLWCFAFVSLSCVTFICSLLLFCNFLSTHSLSRTSSLKNSFIQVLFPQPGSATFLWFRHLFGGMWWRSHWNAIAQSH